MNTPFKTTIICGPTPFRLSRVYAKGWVAGSSSDHDPDDARAMASMNPYDTEIERAKWLQGFKEAQARHLPK